MEHSEPASAKLGNSATPSKTVEVVKKKKNAKKKRMANVREDKKLTLLKKSKQENLENS